MKFKSFKIVKNMFNKENKVFNKKILYYFSPLKAIYGKGKDPDPDPDPYL